MKTAPLRPDTRYEIPDTERPGIEPIHFADRLVERLRVLGHPLCAGLDPHLALIPPLFRSGSMSAADPHTAGAVRSFLFAFLDRIAEHVAVVKPQIAFFEQMGWRGIHVLEEVVASARQRGLLVLLDAKRGDIGSTADAYAQYLNPHAALAADAITINPYLGRDSLRPFFDAATQHGGGVFVLVKTSNPGSGDYQDRHVDGMPLYEVVAESMSSLADNLRGPRTGWSSLGIVAGATYPAQSERLREILPRALFLVPGYGAQGGSAADALRGFVRGASGHLEGGVVNSSRGLLFPKASMTDDVHVWEAAIDTALQAATQDLSTS